MCWWSKKKKICSRFTFSLTTGSWSWCRGGRLHEAKTTFLHSQYWFPMVLILMISIYIASGIHQMSARDAYFWLTDCVIDETNWSTEILNWWRGMLEMTKFYHWPISKVMLVCQHDRIVWSFDLFRPSFHYKIRRRKTLATKSPNTALALILLHNSPRSPILPHHISSSSNISTPPQGAENGEAPAEGAGGFMGGIMGKANALKAKAAETAAAAGAGNLQVSRDQSLEAWKIFRSQSTSLGFKTIRQFQSLDT